jgi:hypothetical protein
MGAFLRFPEREGGGWNLPNTKNALTPSELRQRTERPVVAAGIRPLQVLSHGAVLPWEEGWNHDENSSLLREEFFYFSSS